MKRLILAAIITAGLLASIQANATCAPGEWNGQPHSVPAGVPRPQPVTNVQAKADRRTDGSGRFDVTVSFTVPAIPAANDVFQGAGFVVFYLYGQYPHHAFYHRYPTGTPIAGRGSHQGTVKFDIGAQDSGREYSVMTLVQWKVTGRLGQTYSDCASLPLTNLPSVIVTLPETPPPLPAAPAPVCRVADDTLTVTWPPVTGATQYTRRLGTEDGTMASATTGSATTWRIPGADLRKQPTYRRAYVNAVNANGASAFRFCTFETPPEPPPPPEVCRWEHRFNTFPAADSPGRGVLRITARKKGARVRIEAFDRADGTGLTVQDLAPDRDRLESGSSVTLGAANMVERFAVEGDSGQHVLIVTHAEHVDGMRAVTASMVRQSGGTSQVIHPDVVEHCEPATPSARVE